MCLGIGIFQTGSKAGFGLCSLVGLLSMKMLEKRGFPVIHCTTVWYTKWSWNILRFLKSHFTTVSYTLVKDVSFIIDFLPQKNSFIINNNEQFTNHIYITKVGNGFSKNFTFFFIPNQINPILVISINFSKLYVLKCLQIKSIWRLL